MLEDDVGRVSEDLLDALGEVARDLETRALLLGRLAALAHHARELVAIDEIDGSESPDELALLGRGDHAHATSAGERAQLRGEDAEPAGSAPDQHLGACLQLAARDQHAVRGEVHEPV